MYQMELQKDRDLYAVDHVALWWRGATFVRASRMETRTKNGALGAFRVHPAGTALSATD